ncbi:GFA family protein [Methyloceanibacter sp.]|uniref:GFA family protein n=1 Tax=Methyloceanibacter sp. TaxID=1965321 RepID=UPI002D5E8990|nr:GFA family protein [Methyloceanibacter sp.]HZP09774.1 GFA family protein [Methyloceanibacter sp.]
MASQQDEQERVARCACGNLEVTTRGEPIDVYICSCLACQRGTGSAFSYAAIFPESAVSSAGNSRTYRQYGDSGRFIESYFCPTCGTAVLFRAEGFPGAVGVPVGCFADPSFARPAKLYWASRRHHWLDLPESIVLINTQ